MNCWKRLHEQNPLLSGTSHVDGLSNVAESAKIWVRKSVLFQVPFGFGGSSIQGEPEVWCLGGNVLVYISLTISRNAKGPNSSIFHTTH